MGRSKTGIKRKKIEVGDLTAAAENVLRNEISVREGARTYNVSRSSLSLHILTHRRYGAEKFAYQASNAVRKVFSDTEEIALVEYLITAAKWNYGRGTKISTPESWETEKKAGNQWFRCFKAGYKDRLSLRKPQVTSLSRMTAFNKEHVKLFFSKLTDKYSRYSLQPTCIHEPSTVTAEREVKQVGRFGESGINVTLIACGSAAGVFIPSLFVFLLVYIKSHMLKNALGGSTGAANKSGWSNSDISFNFFYPE
ncbi:hypothetical protein ILUMI_24482 [Ignelater luminosus]|uniref:HTH psq-type domain-containing protein n=1 Tax=Ignelater luminosus TaxID=2038154 RepID=A0A8K0FWK2_IGNLU|nr:hypothetical protein ILUMI_24482 [Ignelater luminosus]